LSVHLCLSFSVPLRACVDLRSLEDENSCHYLDFIRSTSMVRQSWKHLNPKIQSKATLIHSLVSHMNLTEITKAAEHIVALDESNLPIGDMELSSCKLTCQPVP